MLLEVFRQGHGMPQHNSVGTLLCCMCDFRYGSVCGQCSTAGSGSAFASYCMDFYEKTTAQHSTDMTV